MRSEAGLSAVGFQIPLSVPLTGENEGRYLQECLETNWISNGPFLSRFEERMAQISRRRFGVAMCNGTSALHIALKLAGVGPEDEVILPSLTFVAPANAARYLGAWPVFIDVEPHSWQIDPELLGRFLAEQCDGQLRNRRTGRRVRCICPVHLLGHPYDVRAVETLANRYDLPIVEDASESLGASFHREPVGARGLMSCFSFNGNKIVTTGAGGILVTNNEELANKAIYLTTQAKDDPVEYVHHEVGYNYRLSNLHAAFGLAQLERLESLVRYRRAVNRRYREGLANVPGLSFQAEAPGARSTFWLTAIQVDPDRFGMDRRQLARHLEHQGIEARPLWQPLHLSPAHRGSFAVGGEVAERLQARGLCLPSSASLSSENQAICIEAIRSAR